MSDWPRAHTAVCEKELGRDAPGLRLFFCEYGCTQKLQEVGRERREIDEKRFCRVNERGEGGGGEAGEGARKLDAHASARDETILSGRHARSARSSPYSASPTVRECKKKASVSSVTSTCSTRAPRPGAEPETCGRSERRWVETGGACVSTRACPTSPDGARARTRPRETLQSARPSAPRPRPARAEDAPVCPRGSGA